MDHVRILETSHLGHHFIAPEYLPKGKDEFYLRDQQFGKLNRAWRHLKANEVEHLVKNGNKADNWDDLYVTDEFDPSLISNSEFYGKIRIGALKAIILEHHDFKIPTGIVQSKIVACDIGDNVAIHNVSYLAHYIIGDLCILVNIDEMHTTDYAKFGNGIVKQGEPEKVRIWLDIMNEVGSRQVAPFDGMIPADAYLWAKYRDDRKLQDKLLGITQKQFDARRGYYGTVGDQVVIKNSRILKDVKVGACCYIKGANKLKNLTLNSSEAERTQIGEGVELVNGIIGYGCHVFYGAKAVRFIIGNQSSLKYGARLINSFLGANSTISCCEVLNNLIFPAHEQHHNNSFLIASVIFGQSNIAAGATIGSNHNSRANDNEVVAGRGFWPGLCSSIKHSSRFASFVLLSKGDYPAEMDIPLPFSLLNSNVTKNQLEVMPAYWWMYNMYALARNTWKFHNRDIRQIKQQNIEFDSLAPDTVEEIFNARRLLEIWTGKAYASSAASEMQQTEDEFYKIGKNVLNSADSDIRHLEILGEGMEKSRRNVVILKTKEAYQAYGQMLLYYSIVNLIQYTDSHPDNSFEMISGNLKGHRKSSWINLGGQLVPEPDVDQLRTDIRNGKLGSWGAIHQRYHDLWMRYPLEKQKHAYATLCTLLNTEILSKKQWIDSLDEAVFIQKLICDRVYESRNKDYENPFRQATFRNRQEMIASIGTIEENSFIQQTREETKSFQNKIKRIKDRS